jgi:hypothetical protein
MVKGKVMKTRAEKQKSTKNGNSPFFKSGAGFIAPQPKLKVGQPGDKYEQEADRVADQVVNGSRQESRPFFAPVPQKQQQSIQEKPLAEGITPIVQMQEEEEEELQPKLLDATVQRQEEEEEELQMKQNDNVSHAAPVEAALSGLSGGGSKMEPATKAEMESGFGVDFSDVNIHTGSDAVQISKQMGAQAFTKGSDIYFNEGKYQPATTQGKLLLAHELTHTIQQINESTSLNVQKSELEGTVETSEGTESIEGLSVSSSAEDIRIRLLTNQALINSRINSWVLENFRFVATSMRVAAESFENWYALNATTSNTTFVFDVLSGGLAILSAAYPPAGITAAILGSVLNIAKTARDAQIAANTATRGNAAIVVEQSMINKSETLRNRAVGFAQNLKSRNEHIWQDAGVAITMNAPSVEVFAKQEFYHAVGIEPVNTNLTQIALSNMIHSYTNWERRNSLRDSWLFVSPHDLEWAFQSEEQRRRRAEIMARRQLGINDQQMSE